MKLNTLLLASAATLVASAAFAADLPSKKAAPAAGSVAVCKVGGMTGFTLPGSDTCLGISGRVRFDASYDLDAVSDDGDLDWTAWGGSAQVRFDARSNTEIGVVRSFLVLDGNNADGVTVDRAYVQFAGITAGRKDSIASVLGTQSDALTLSDREEEGIDYQINVGGLNFGLGLEAPNNNNDDDASADNPDIVAHLSGKVGDVGFAVAAVSHEAYNRDDVTTNGYAVLGNVNYTVNGLRLGVFGGMAENASAYTGGAEAVNGWHLHDYDGWSIDDLESQLWGLSAVYSAGKLTIGAEYASYDVRNVEDDPDWEEGIETQETAFFVGYQVAKGLSLYGEYHHIASEWEDDGVVSDAGESNTVLFRIQRDF